MDFLGLKTKENLAMTRVELPLTTKVADIESRVKAVYCNGNKRSVVRIYFVEPDNFKPAFRTLRNHSGLVKGV